MFADVLASAASELLAGLDTQNEAANRIQQDITTLQWQLLQQRMAPAPLPTPAPPPPPRVVAVAETRPGSPERTPGAQTQCSACKLYFAGTGTDCYSFSLVHAPGIKLVICAPCIFDQMRDMERPQRLMHGLALIYRR